LWRSWRPGTTLGLEAPAWYLFAASLLLSAGGLCCAYMLGDAPANRPLAAGFYLSQLGKYMLGLVWQALA
jgi:hypothetical protein